MSYHFITNRTRQTPDDLKVRPKVEPKRYKNKLEQQFAWELESQQKAGEISWWAYEPVTLVIVDGGERCRYTPDFMTVQVTGDVLNPIPVVTFYETKGFMREAARIRFLAARERYPFWKFVCVRRAKGGWEEIL